MFKKLLVSLLIATVFLTNFATIAKAQSTSWYNQSYKEWKTKVFDSPDNEIFGERYTFAQVQWIVYSLSVIMSGTEIVNCTRYLDPGGESDKEEFQKCMEGIGPAQANSGNDQKLASGAIGGAALLMDGLLSVRPVSGVEYIASAASRFHLVPETYAQGFGFKSIEPIQKMWKAFRNMAYGLMVLVVLAMAFMIMFRVKISPQVVISVQSALPKLVGILILITFSYAIAGFMVDLSYLVVALIIMFIKSQGLIGNLNQTVSALEIAQRAWGNTAAWWPMFSLYTLISFPLILAGAVGAFFTGGLSLLIILVIFVFIFLQIIRTLWAMLKAFINVILLVIFGPLLIMLGGIAPAMGGFTVWFRNLAANIAVFPTIVLMVFLAHLLYWSFPHFFLDFEVLDASLRNVSWINPFEVGKNIQEGVDFALPAFNSGGLWGLLTPVIIALGILLIVPAAADLIKSLIQGQPFNYGQAMGQAFGLPLTAGKGLAAWRVGVKEDARREAYESSGSTLPYEPHWGTKALRAIGWTK